MSVVEPLAAASTRVRVALVFPAVNSVSSQGVPPSGSGAQDPKVPTAEEFRGEEVDFVLFPEAYVSPSDSDRVASLSALASDLNVPMLVGAAETDGAGRTWQTLFRFSPEESPQRVYTKHSTAEAVAFELPDWDPHVNLQTFELGHLRVGATICHDHYLGLLPRHVAAGGARVWVNPSYDNVSDVKWSSILRLRAVENRVFALCTLHDVGKRTSTHPFGFSPNGGELYARQAGRHHSRPLSACREPDSVYVVDLDMRRAGQPLDWAQLPETTKPPRPHLGNPQLQRLVRLAAPDGKPSVWSTTGWQNIDVSMPIETDHGLLYVGLVADDDILDAAACFRVLDEAAAVAASPVVWNHWHRLASRPAQVAPLMMGRAIECCAPVVLSDPRGVCEVVELSNRSKVPVRRALHQNGEGAVDLRFAWGLHNAFNKIVTDRVRPRHLRRHLRERALDRYRTLA